MNGSHVARSATMNGKHTQTNAGYNGSDASNGQSVVGRYTVLSKSVSKRNGTSANAGSYYVNPNSEALNRMQFQHKSGHNSQQQQQQQQQLHKPTERTPLTNGNTSRDARQTNGHIYRTNSVTSGDSATPYTDFFNSGSQRGRHVKSNSVTSSNYFFREANPGGQATTLTGAPTAVGGDYRTRDLCITNNRSVGGSLSCGQPSPSSTAEDSIVSSALSPTSLRVDTGVQSGTQQQQVQRQQQQQQQQQTQQHYWLHQSELTLPTDRDAAVLTARHKSRSATLEPEFKARSTGSFSTLDSVADSYYPTSNGMMYNSAAMGQGHRNGTDDYLGSFASGPSHRKIQNLHGSGASQRRFPSDTTLNFTSRDSSQVYTSGIKPGPVTIPARSRSAQPSPGQSPLASPTNFYRASESNLLQDFDKRTPRSRTQQIDLQYGGNAAHRGTSSPPHLENKQRLNSYPMKDVEDEVESPILPSVREIIRQVELMTQSNAATSTTDISALGHTTPGITTSGIPRPQRQSLGSLQQPQTISLQQQQPLLQQQQQRRNLVNGDHFTRGGILRQGGSSQRTPSAPQLRSAPYTPLQAKFNSIAAAAVSASTIARQTNPAPPVPPHGTQARTTKTIMGSFTRRGDAGQNDTQRFDVLREAFIEQRREIQRLRKQLAEKDVVINQMQSDIRLYEPWR